MTIDRHNDLIYDSSGSRSLKLDLLRPDADADVPVVIYLHAGGWMAGDRRSDERFFLGLVEEGLAIASVDYRLSDEATFPAPLDDVRTALRWLKAHASQLGVQAERIGAWGSSAGAQLAMLLGYSPSGEAEPGLAAIVGYFGTYELRPRAAAARFAPGAQLPDFVRQSGLDWPMHPTFEARLLGVQDVSEAPVLAEQASPVAHASSTGPPVLLLHGEADGLASPDQSRWMNHALQQAGGDSALLLIADANHEDPAFERPEILGATAQFLHAKLKGPAES